MQNSFEVEHRLGYRILRWILAVALVSGVIVSTIQVILDAQRVSLGLDNDAEQTIAMVKDAATQAVFSIDAELAQQVVDGLFAKEAVHMARIVHPDGDPLGNRNRPLQETAFRPVTDPIFEAERLYREPLFREGSPESVYGYLDVHYDTAPAARTWLDRAAVTFASGIATALILGMVLFYVFHLLLTRPLLRIVSSVKQVDPAHPDDRLVSTPSGHQSDELGLWVNATNNLLVAIGDSQKRHREAEDRVSRLSRYDQLTGLPSRDTFMELLVRDIEDASKRNAQLSLIVCGIDDFKSVNEQCGFRSGDLILQTIADRLTSS